MIMKKILLALIVVLAVATVGMGTTFAGFCDTEMVKDSALTTGYLDLKVARAGDPAFYDDQPWGPGLFPVETEPGVFVTVPCFQAEEEPAHGFDGSYICNLKLWNAGSTHGRAYIHIRGVVAESLGNPADLLTNTIVTLWYDLDDDGNSTINDGEPDEATDEAEVVTGTLGELNCQMVPPEPWVWMLPANELRNLQIVIDPPEGAPGDSLTFNIQFNLGGFYFNDDKEMVGVGFCDTEVCLNNYLGVKVEE